MNRRAAFRRRKSNMMNIVLIISVVCILAAAVWINCRSLKVKQAELSAREELLMAQIEEQNAYTQELVELKKYTKTKKFAEEVAKEKLGLVYKDEIVFKPE